MTSHLQPLSADQHLGLGLRSVSDWAFCKTRDAVPIALSEFADMAGWHPIVFSTGPVPMPLAVLGTQQGKNDFLDASFQWPAHHQPPTALKLLPFSLGVDASDATRTIVMVDLADTRLVPLEEDEAAQPLFTFDGKPSPTLSSITQRLGAHEAALKEASALGLALAQSGLLEDMHADIRTPDGTTHRTRTFRSVSGSRFRSLATSDLERWFRLGWTDAVALHLASLRRWVQLFERHQLKITASASVSHAID
ncbi:SapC family protein [Ottowia thiooxydans]|uniref:SapC family protein n=1 Tax=Ottowia thiooxydans TaxID=219182 RepID=UPI0003FD4E44|nr:SapC family protein [Ottowia thiooxydans]